MLFPKRIPIDQWYLSIDMAILCILTLIFTPLIDRRDRITTRSPAFFRAAQNLGHNRIELRKVKTPRLTRSIVQMDLNPVVLAVPIEPKGSFPNRR